MTIEDRELELDNALKEHDYDVFGLSELGREEEAIIERTNGDILCYKEIDGGMKGVGFLIHNMFKNCIQEFRGINERTAVLLTKIKGISVSITRVYALTKAASDDKIEGFYEDIIGDFNSKVEQKLQIEEIQIGPYGLGTRNNRGSILIQFAQENRIYIMKTFFKKCPSSKGTWQSPDRRTRNKIDYILSNRRGNIRN